MENITKQQKAEAKAYNDTIKNSMIIEDKLEILFIDLIHNTLSNENLENILNEIIDKNKLKILFIDLIHNTLSNENLENILNEIIDNYSENGESLEPKVRELITLQRKWRELRAKEANQ